VIAMMNNYQTADKHAIQYDLRDEGNGWVLHVRVPEDLGPRDRSTIVEWLRRYQQTVNKQHPAWLTAFRVVANGYILHMQKTGSVRDLVDAAGWTTQGDRIRERWNRTLEYA
jgi:hypothetical protein